MRALFDAVPFSSHRLNSTPGFLVRRNVGSLWSVRLWGALTHHWADRFTRNLSAEGLSILNGFARQNGSGIWGAEFLLTSTLSSSSPDSVDFLALTEKDSAERAPSIVLDDYDLDGSPEHGAVLFLQVRGPDQVGFLGSLLGSLSELDLAPIEMTIVTRDGEAYDRFLLKSSYGRIPTDATREALDRKLTRMRRVRGEAVA